MINSGYYKSLAQLFSAPVLTSLCAGQPPEFMRYVLRHSGYEAVADATLGQMFEDLYDLLLRNYRCEYIYKNALANKILLGRHAPTTSTLLTEFGVGSCKADVVILNGTSSVYEIKTELDSLDRLDTQIATYLKTFDNVFVVTHQSQLDKLSRALDERAGIILLTERYTLQTVREASSNKASVDAGIIFDSLRQAEYCRLVKDNFGFVPDVPNTMIYRACRDLVTTLDPVVVHTGMVNILKRRSSGHILKELIKDIPRSLRLLYAANRITAKQHTNFLSTLSAKVTALCG